MKNIRKNQNKTYYSSTLLIIGFAVFLLSCGGNTEVGTQNPPDETTALNTANTENQTPIDERESFENFEAVTVTLENPENFNWKSFTSEFPFKNVDDSNDRKVVSNWIEWGEYQYRLEIHKLDNTLELLTFIRIGNNETADKNLLTMELADELKLSSLWTQMETLAVDLESNPDSKIINLKSDT